MINMKKLLFASMMCSDFTDLKSEVKNLEKAGIDSFHCDVMDGIFVKNMTMGTLSVKAIKQLTDLMIDVHLMVEKPREVVDLYIDLGVDLIYIHPEAERYAIKTMQYLKEKGLKAGLAVNPETSYEEVKEILYEADYVMLMTVSPGFAGQKFLEFTEEKIKTFVKYKNKYNYKLILDGACSEEVIEKFTKIGVDGFVLGTSALFENENSYIEQIEKIRLI